MTATPELIALIQRNRAREAERSGLVRIAECARSCATTSAGIFERLARTLRLAPDCC